MNTKYLLVDPFYRWTHQYNHNTTPLTMLWLRKANSYLMATEAGLFSLHALHKGYKHLRVYFYLFFNETALLPSKRTGPKLSRYFVQNPNCEYVVPISPGCRDLLAPFEYQDHISRYGICINQIRRLWCRLIPILTWQRFYVELVLTMLYILPNTDNRQQGCINRCVSWHIISPPIVFTKLRLSFAWSHNWYIRSRSIINPSDNTLDSRDVILRLWRSMPCLLMLWLLKSPVHQQAWHWQCRTDTECVSMLKS